MENEKKQLKEEMDLLALLRKVPYGYRDEVVISMKCNGGFAVTDCLDELLAFIKAYPTYGVILKNYLLLGYSPSSAMKAVSRDITRDMALPDFDMSSKLDLIPVDDYKNMLPISEKLKNPILDILPDRVENPILGVLPDFKIR